MHLVAPMLSYRANVAQLFRVVVSICVALALTPAGAIPGQPGTLDASFATGSPLGAGKTMIPIGSGNDFATAVALQPDGKIVLVGQCSNGANDDFCALRLDGGPFGARNCSLDIDGDNRVLATTDSLIHTRIALGMTGNAVIIGISFPVGATRTNWPLIREYIVTQCGMSLPV
jgi:hypothetical protein